VPLRNSGQILPQLEILEGVVVGRVKMQTLQFQIR